MTKEEYEQCKIDQYSDDPLKALQARFILTMFPTQDAKFAAKTNQEMTEFMNRSEVVIRGLLGEYHDL